MLPVAPSVAWTYDESYGAKYGNSFGVAALTGDDANENKALIAQYNKLLLAKGWAKATDSDFDDFDVIGLALYGTNVYCMDDTDSDKRLVAEIIPCADAEGDGLMRQRIPKAMKSPLAFLLLFKQHKIKGGCI